MLFKCANREVERVVKKSSELSKIDCWCVCQQIQSPGWLCLGRLYCPSIPSRGGDSHWTYRSRRDMERLRQCSRCDCYSSCWGDVVQRWDPQAECSQHSQLRDTSVIPLHCNRHSSYVARCMSAAIYALSLMPFDSNRSCRVTRWDAVSLDWEQTSRFRKAFSI